MGFLWLQHFNAPWKEENAYVRKKSWSYKKSAAFRWIWQYCGAGLIEKAVAAIFKNTDQSTKVSDQRMGLLSCSGWWLCCGIYTFRWRLCGIAVCVSAWFFGRTAGTYGDKNAGIILRNNGKLPIFYKRNLDSNIECCTIILTEPTTPLIFMRNLVGLFHLWIILCISIQNNH